MLPDEAGHGGGVPVPAVCQPGAEEPCYNLVSSVNADVFVAKLDAAGAHLWKFPEVAT